MNRNWKATGAIRCLAVLTVALGLTACDPASLQSGAAGSTGVVSVPDNQTIAPTTRNFIIVDSSSGYVLDGRGVNEEVQVASLTKIATAMVVINWMESSGVPSSTQIPITPTSLQYPGINPLGLQVGDTMSIRDLLYAALMNSDNIAAMAMAEYTGTQLGGAGNPVGTFVDKMNALAKQLNMRKTRFTDPSGIDNIPGQAVPYSTAADMARLCKYAMSRAAFRFKVSQGSRQVTVYRGGQPLRYTLRNTNDLVGARRIDGIKTGKTRLAGGCLALSEELPPKVWQEGETFYRIDRRLIVVLLGSSNRTQDGKVLMQHGWALHDNWIANNRPMEAGRGI